MSTWNSGTTGTTTGRGLGAVVKDSIPSKRQPGEIIAMDKKTLEIKGQKVRDMLRATLGEDVYTCWFAGVEFEAFDGDILRLTVATTFLRNWIKSHFANALMTCTKSEFTGITSVEVNARQHAPSPAQPSPQQVLGRDQRLDSQAPRSQPMPQPNLRGLSSGHVRSQTGAFDGSPLEQRYTFDRFMVGASNRFAHSAAMQVAETAMGSEARRFNPLYLHAAVGHGKSHILQAIAWEVKRRHPTANVLYLTAERFRFQFVEALRSQDPMAFKEKFRALDLLLIDDLEFMHGQQTELEFDHIINSLLDSGRQLVVASARPPNHIDRLNERMRSRLQRGLVVEIESLDQDLRRQVLAKRVQEQREIDSTFAVPPEVLDLLAGKLTENARDLEGAVTRLHAAWQYMKTPITMDSTEAIIRDLVQGLEPRRIKIEDILKVVSRHFGVSKGDLLSQRRHRSVVWPRQIGMYLAKQLTQRSLPEIGRRFGNRDHTTVLHAIRKIEGQLPDDARLRDELDELKKLLNH